MNKIVASLMHTHSIIWHGVCVCLVICVTSVAFARHKGHNPNNVKTSTSQTLHFSVGPFKPYRFAVCFTNNFQLLLARCLALSRAHTSIYRLWILFGMKLIYVCVCVSLSQWLLPLLLLLLLHLIRVYI